MKISASSSGGFAGLNEHYEIDTQTHPAGQAIEAALASSDFFNGAPDGEPILGADIPRWRISVEGTNARRTISFAEDGGAANAHWQNLLTQIRAAS